MLERVSARLLETEAALADFANGSVASRPASVLLRLAGPDSEGVVHASHDQLAAHLGSYHETVSTTLYRFQDQGLVEAGAGASGCAMWPASSGWSAAELMSAHVAAEW